MTSIIPGTDLEVEKNFNDGTMWTLRDFVLEDDIILGDGTMLPAGERFFTWSQAMALQKMGAFHEGCRLPKAEEVETLARHRSVSKRYKFDTLHGFLDRPHHGERRRKGMDTNVSYWTSDVDEKDAVVLEIYRIWRTGYTYDFYVPHDYAIKRSSSQDYGFCIRLVYDPQ